MSNRVASRRGDAQQDRQHVARFGEVLAQRGQLALIGGKLGLRAQHFNHRAAARRLPRAGEREVAAALVDQRRLGGDAITDGGNHEIFGDHATGDGEMGSLGLVQLRFALGAGLLQRAAVFAPQIGIVADAAAQRIEIEDRVGEARGQREAEGGKVHLLVFGAGVGVCLRQAAAGNLGDVLAGAAQRGVAGGKAGVVGQRAGHQGVQFGRAEGLPPAPCRAFAQRGDGRIGRVVHRASPAGACGAAGAAKSGPTVQPAVRSARASAPRHRAIRRRRSIQFTFRSFSRK